MAGEVHTSSIALGQQHRLVYVNTYALFFQDAWQVSRKLSVNYGVRYEYFGPLYDRKRDLSTFIPSAAEPLLFQGAGISSLYPPDRTNFAPRAGFAYRPREQGNLVVRAGFGIYYDQPNLNPFLDNQPLNNGAIGVLSNPAGANPISVVEADNYTLRQNTYIFPAAGSACPTGNGCGNIFNIFSVSQNFRTAYNYNYNLNVEQRLGDSVLLALGYVGSQGRKLLTLADINQPSLGDPATAQQRRPYFAQFPDFGIINQIESNGSSNYNSLQTTIRVKSWHRVTSQFAYTWAHALDDMTGYRGALPQNSFDLKADYGNSDYDTRHNFTSLFSYELPKPARGPEWLLGGWQAGALLSFHTGQPFSVLASPDNSGTNENVQRVDLVGDPSAGVSHSIVSADGFKYVQWVNPAAFASPAPGSFGSMRRNQIYGPGYGDVDFSVVDNIKVTERLTLQFRSEIYNLFNRVNLAPPESHFAGPNAQNGFGLSFDTIGDFNGAPGIGPGEPLNVQFAMKVIF
jgi:TonB dependent receptor